MTRAEFARIAVVLDECWPGDFTETAEAAYFAVLGTRHARQVEAAVRQCVDKGFRHRPTPSEIVREANPMVDREAFLLSQRSAFASRYGEARAIEFFANALPTTTPAVN